MAANLEPLPPVERLSPRCIRILGGNPGKFTLQGTNTYLLGTGRHRILIDTGEGRPAWIESLRAVLEDQNAVVESALISHWHQDHVGGIDDLLQAFPRTKVYRNHPASSSQRALRDGDLFTAEGVTLTAVHTPGHTGDHMVFVLAEEDAMFTADNVLGHGTAIFEDLASYINSLGKMQALFAGRVYPGHGPVVEEGPERIAQYIKHRREREDQVVRVMRAGTTLERHEIGVWTAMEIVKVVYQDVSPDLYPAASHGVSQILRKLKQEGKVAQMGEDQWRITSAHSDA